MGRRVRRSRIDGEADNGITVTKRTNMDDSHEQCGPEEAEKDDEVSQKRTGHTQVKEREWDKEESVKRTKHNRSSCCLERWRYKKQTGWTAK